ncbi:hypothetical protein [Radiobacillus sp. PE A8.2]|uniref:hypothetical protein n=1 Tax=Radiobacillus sp. PE A8.2 TaxID=3380349 RepID=UPI00388D69D9
MPLTDEARNRLREQLKKQSQANSNKKPKTKIRRESLTSSTRKRREFEDRILENVY